MEDLSYQEAQRILRLTQWEMRSAVDESILRKLPSGLIDGDDVAEALRDRDEFIALVHREHPVNAGQAANLLGVHVNTFRRLVRRHPIPVHSIKPFLRDKTTVYWRQEDVLSLRKHLSSRVKSLQKS